MADAARPSTDLPLRDRLLARLSPASGPLQLGGIAAHELAERFGTPLYVYDAALLRAQFAAVQRALGAQFGVLYALKANPCVAVARTLRGCGAGVELASAGEICIATAAGFAGAQMQFAGPGKTEAELAAALDAQVATLNLESPAEYERLAALARARGTRPGVAIRVNPAHEVSGSRMRMGGGSKKFGVDASEVLALAQRIERDGHCNLLGLHMYAGTQLLDAQSFVATAAQLRDLGADLERALGRPLLSYDFGGGFGVPVFDGDPSFDLASAGRSLQAIAGRPVAGQRFFVELGRYLVAEAGVYLTRVVEVKVSHGKRFAILDGGMHHFGAASGLGAVIKRPYPVVACADPRASGVLPTSGTCTLGGPLCTPADELAGELTLAELRAGDLVAVLVAGAYALTFSPTLFLSHPAPAEVLVDGGRATLARRRQMPQDALRDQVWDDG